MALNDKKLEKMVQKSEQLKKRIRNDMEESKKIENEIKVMSYDNIVAEATSHGITLDDNFFDSVSIINELKANGIAAALFATLSTGTAVFAEETADVTTVPEVTEKPEETTTVISEAANENAASGEVTAETASSEQFSPDDVLKFFNLR